MNYDDKFIYSFIERTLENLDTDCKNDVTQHINSLLGVLVMPKERMWEKLEKCKDIYNDLSILKNYVKKYSKESTNMTPEHEEIDINVALILKGLRDGLCHSYVYANITKEGDDAEEITDIAIGASKKSLTEYKFECCKCEFEFVFECKIDEFKKIVIKIAEFYKKHVEKLF